MVKIIIFVILSLFISLNLWSSVSVLKSKKRTLDEAGILCLYGDEKSCHIVKKSQDQEGRFWSSQADIGIERKNAFSKDEFNGVMAYLVATKDKLAAKKYEQYLISNKWKICPLYSGFRCRLTLSNLGLMGNVWQYLGLKVNKKLVRNMVTFSDTSYILETSYLHEKNQKILPSYVYLIYKKIKDAPPSLKLSEYINNLPSTNAEEKKLFENCGHHNNQTDCLSLIKLILNNQNG